MINTILTGIFNLMIGLIDIVLKPIDLIIQSVLPDLSSAISSIGSFLNIISQGLGWAISITGLSSECLSLIVLYFTFKLTSPILFSTIKSAIKWYDKLKV